MPSFDRCTIYNVINKYGTAAEERINKMEKKEQLYEGKAKKVFKTDDPKCLIVDYKDDATAFNGEKKGQIVGKGVVNNTMTNIILQLLEELDTDGKGAPRDELERRAEAEGISAIELEEISNTLMDKGLVYEPNLRYLKKI